MISSSFHPIKCVKKLNSGRINTIYHLDEEDEVDEEKRSTIMLGLIELEVVSLKKNPSVFKNIKICSLTQRDINFSN